MIFAILGLGEAGSTLGRDLIQAGAAVRGWDPTPKELSGRLQMASSNSEAIKGADIILSVNWASVMVDVAAEVANTLKPNQLYVDLNTSSPARKRAAAAVIESVNGRFVDGALMGPVPNKGIKTAVYVSGNGAEQFAAQMPAFGMPVTVVGRQPGEAATRKLIRSIMYKGVAAVVVECLRAARQLDMEPYARQQMMTMLADEGIIDRFEAGSRKHATRRRHEMEAVVELLDEVGVSAFTSHAAVKSLAELEQTNES